MSNNDDLAGIAIANTIAFDQLAKLLSAYKLIDIKHLSDVLETRAGAIQPEQQYGENTKTALYHIVDSLQANRERFHLIALPCSSR